jgi:hypothetical protein
MEFAALPANLRRVRSAIAEVQAREGLRGEVRIVAVTKGYPPEAARAARAAGLEDIGENRVQEALGKREQLADLGLRWHLIGHLQTNKAKLVPGRFEVVQSVDSVRVADALARAAERSGKPVTVLVQVNVAGEEQKSGCSPDEAADVVGHAAGLPRICVRGLMAMAPFTNDEAIQRRSFAALRNLRDRLETIGYRLPELSMGMSGDYLAAVAEGATMVRLGTVLFGERPA